MIKLTGYAIDLNSTNAADTQKAAFTINGKVVFGEIKNGGWVFTRELTSSQMKKVGQLLQDNFIEFMKGE